MIKILAPSDPGALVASGRESAVASCVRLRYDRVAVWLHWGIGALLLVEIAFGLLLDDIAPRGTPARGAVINLHKSFGIVLGVLIVLRIAWRLAHAPPPWPASMSAARRRAANAGHAALYACMLIAPLAGYLGSNFSKHGVRFFGTELPPWGPDWPRAYAFLVGVHDASTYLLLALVLGHVAMALRHALVERDGIFDRIIPWPSSRGRASST
ncbi:MAG TPA: cytochrome b [Caldimonas sp.]|nr:cytochrome b [Caldimonas sp.]HEX4233863.1 cytochrome b [Caldimonas sp.]